MPANSALSDLLASNPLRLAYSIPLLLISIPLLFAGTFLTLDRSRSFPSSGTDSIALPGAFSKVKREWRILFGLRGGAGGLASGYVFGVQLSTFLSLLIPAVSTSAPLSPKSFFPVWILSSVLTTILGGRYRYFAIPFSALSGGTSLALAISVIIHPPLPARQVLVVLISLLSTIIILLCCIPRFFHLLRPSLRISTASSGAFSLVVTIALLSHNDSWGNIWQRLWVSDGEGWGDPVETGLSAAYCIFTCLGVAADWALRRWLGECPDEKWDHYLANYAANLPNDPSRAGTFQPLPHSFFGRLFYPPSKNDIVFPSTSSSKLRDSTASDSIGLMSDSVVHDFATESPGKSRSPFATPTKKGNPKMLIGRKRPVKFGAGTGSDSSDDDSATVPSLNARQGKIRPWLREISPPRSSAPTLVDSHDDTTAHESDLELASRPRKGFSKANAIPDYSDYEEDLGVFKERREAGFVPDFMKQHVSGSSSERTASVSLHSSASVKKDAFSTSMTPVPITPSLIKAIDRVTAAQNQAFAARNPLPSKHSPATISPTRPAGEGDGGDSDDEAENVRRHGWDDFWRDVKRKAGN